MLTINCLFLSRAHDRNKEKTQKVSKVLSVRKIYKNMHMPQFFQPTLLNSKFLYKRGALIARLVLVNIPVPAQRRTF